MKQPIINRPDLQKPAQWTIFTAITLLLWLLYFYLWLPLISLAAWYLGFRFFEHYMLDAELHTYMTSLGWYALVIMLIAIMLVGWSRYNLSRFRDKDRRKPLSAVSREQVAKRFHLPVERLHVIQHAKVMELHIHPDEHPIEFRDRTFNLIHRQGIR